MSKWNPPRREVTHTKHVIELDIPAQIRANEMRTRYGWEVYVSHDGPPNGGKDIVSANLPRVDDGYEWFHVIFDDKGEG